MIKKKLNMIMKGYKRKNVLIGVASFLTVLFTMPLGHALMILMEHLLSPTALHCSAFAMGGVGIALTVAGVFASGDTRQTLWGLFGGLLFWTGWIEFLFVYYAHRFGVQPLLDETGAVVTKPEYLIMPVSFGFWAMFMLFYLFSVKTGCNFFNFLQRILFRRNALPVKPQPMMRHVAIVTFMELNLILWTSYLVLLFCYDDNFIGDRHPVTTLVAFGSLVGSAFMFRRLLRIGQWGYAIRFAIPVVIVFWTFVEILGRWNLFREIWVEPMKYKMEMITVLVALVVLLGVIKLKNKSR
jgi:hypothetical protein